MSGFTGAHVPDQSGKTFIVTGSNTGIGFEAAKALATQRARVLLACRDEQRAAAAMATIRKSAPDADIAFLPLDQADLASVRRASEIATAEPRIDVLLNNAGVMIPPLTRTKDGFERQFGVNHLGTFALTALLLPKLAQSPGARVVVTGSTAHQKGDLKWDDLDAHEKYNRFMRYSDSKLANLLFLGELDRRLRAAHSPVIAVGCHPGVAATDLQRHLGPLRFLLPLFRPFLNTAEGGSWPALQAATAPDVEPGGYYGPQGPGERRGPSGHAPRTDAAADLAAARRLWEISIVRTDIDPGLAPA